MKKIRVKFVNCVFFENNVRPILEKYYEVEDSDDPEYAFFDYLDYRDCTNYNCVRILYIGENARPDFNLFDYAVSFDDIIFDNRNLRLPIYAMPTNRDRHLNRALNKNTNHTTDDLKKKAFCCFVVSNGRGANPVREEFFKELSNYKHIDSAGRFLNNMPGGANIPGEETQGFARNYKFQICFENSEYKGYTTEKIFNAWGAGVIPIYWGDPEIADIFNPNAFVRLRNTSKEEIEKTIHQVIKLDQDDKAYIKMREEPIITGELPDYLRPGTLDRFLCEIINQPYERAIKRTNYRDGYGYYYERDFRRHVRIDKTSLASLIYKMDEFRRRDS